MQKTNKELEFRDKVLKGLDLAFEKLLEFKRQKNSYLVIMQGDKIVKVTPDEYLSLQAEKSKLNSKP